MTKMALGKKGRWRRFVEGRREKNKLIEVVNPALYRLGRKIRISE